MEKQNLPDSRPMVGGDGVHSYSTNSAYQGGAVNAGKKLISEGVTDKLDSKILGPSKTFRIADFGCSTGPNTFVAVQNIIEAVERKLLQENPCAAAAVESIDFQVFFNDHTENDFNTLFRSLPHHQFQSSKYFAAGVPGSFYNRLFPKSSLHFVHTSYTLHWLSKFPNNNNNKVAADGTLELDDAAAGSFQTRRFSGEVIKSYADQFNKDFDSFLNHRAQELVPGGLAALVIFAVPDGIPMANHATATFYNLFGSSIVEMAKMGIISEEKVNSFDVPMHNPTPRELEAIILKNGNFSIERMEKMTNPNQQVLYSARDAAFSVRAAFGGIVKEHFGEEFVDQIFNIFETKCQENLSLVIQNVQDGMMDLFILLKRH